MPTREFRQIEWDEDLDDDCRQLVRLAIREDLDRFYDWTTVVLVPEGTSGGASVVARRPGVVAGIAAAQILLDEFDHQIAWRPKLADGATVAAGQALAHLSGPARSLLTAERPLLNLLGRLCGIATLTRTYVEAVFGTRARIYDTRKTTPGWRRLEKYAVRAGGGMNHRLGLYDAILIKDNHLALSAPSSPAEAVRRVRGFLQGLGADDPRSAMIVEVEVDTTDQLAAVLPERPDIVLLDNMTPDELRQAVALRDAGFAQVELEASGNVNLQTVRAIAASGVERISVGALTHSASWLDIGLDWD